MLKAHLSLLKALVGPATWQDSINALAPCLFLNGAEEALIPGSREQEHAPSAVQHGVGGGQPRAGLGRRSAFQQITRAGPAEERDGQAAIGFRPGPEQGRERIEGAQAALDVG